MKIDMHVHYMPPERALDEAFYKREPYWRLLTQPGSASVQGWADGERMLGDMDQAGIDQVVIQGEYFSSHLSAQERNREVSRLCRQHPDRIRSFAALQPKAGAVALDELHRCLDDGMLGVGEISPYAQGFGMEDSDFMRIAEACISFNVPLLLHANEEVGRYYRGKATTPLSHYYQLALRYPELKLILAHWGGGLFFYELMPDVRKTLRNVWYDTAASPLLFPTGKIFSIALQCVDWRKILFASDYPLLLYPRKKSKPDFSVFLAEIENLGLDGEAKEGILGLNAARLIGNAQAEGKTSAIADRSTSQAAPEITEEMSVSWIASIFPETRRVLEQYGIPWQDSSVPVWEPLIQSACARGLDEERFRSLLTSIQDAIRVTKKAGPDSQRSST